MKVDRAAVLAKLQVLGLLAIGLGGLLVYAWPGYMSVDSLQQYLEGRARHYGDWHPPAMAAIWTVTDFIIHGPGGMLLLQSTLFLAGVYRILRRVFPPRTAALVASAVLLFPPILPTLSVIWKDSQMAGYLMFAASLLLDDKRWQRLTGLAFIVIATAVRINAIASTLPLVVLLFYWAPSHRWLKRSAIAFVVWLATFGAAQAIDKKLTDVEQHVWPVGLCPGDIVGTLKQSRDYSDEELVKLFDGIPLLVPKNIQQHMRTYYNPYNWYFYVSGRHIIFPWPENDAHRASYVRIWKQLIVDNPGAYLLHRLRVWRGIIGWTNLKLNDPAWGSHVDIDDPTQPNPFRAAQGIQASINGALLWLARNTVLYRAWVYLLLTLAFIPLAIRQRDVLALLLSGLFHTLALFPIGPSNDVRYTHWLFATTTVAAIILFVRRFRGFGNPAI